TASNANLTGVLPFVTGGSWKKSPRVVENMVCTWMPPNGSGILRSWVAISASLSNKSPSNIDTSGAH
ncbi:hypothetical protein NEOLEDRAFT_1060106, partial [Neolentinus lepideus HHB14362 ss-1]